MIEPERIECTRATFAKLTGRWPDPDVIGVCVVNQDRTRVEVEYVFIDDPVWAERYLVAELERIYKL